MVRPVSKFAATSDTAPEVEAMMVERWRQMTPAEKMATVTELNEAVEMLAWAGVRTRHPEATEEESRMRVAALRLGRDLMMEVYGWDPDERGW